MRLIKMLGLAVVAVVAMAFVGAPMVSANSETIVLCEAAELECEKPFPEKTMIVAHASNPVFLAGTLGNLKCNESLLEVELLNKLGTKAVGHVTALTFTECEFLPGMQCTLTSISRGDLLLTKSGALSTTVNLIPSESGAETKIATKCGFFVNCTIGGSPMITADSTKGGETKLYAKEASVEETSGLCPEILRWDATYVILKAMWIES